MTFPFLFFLISWIEGILLRTRNGTVDGCSLNIRYPTIVPNTFRSFKKIIE